MLMIKRSSDREVVICFLHIGNLSKRHYRTHMAEVQYTVLFRDAARFVNRDSYYPGVKILTQLKRDERSLTRFLSIFIKRLADSIFVLFDAPFRIFLNFFTVLEVISFMPITVTCYLFMHLLYR